VESSPWIPHSAESNAGWVELTRASSARAEELLSAASRTLDAWDIEAELLRTEDDAAKAILRLAEERQADLVIVGARGSEERGFLIGSVSQKVKALAGTDVLVVRPGAPLDRPRALLAVDGSRESLLGIESFARKTRADQADVRLLHALDRPPRTVWNVFSDEDDVEPQSLPEPLRRRVEHAFCPALAALRAHGSRQPPSFAETCQPRRSWTPRFATVPT